MSSIKWYQRKGALDLGFTRFTVVEEYCFEKGLMIDKGIIVSFDIDFFWISVCRLSTTWFISDWLLKLVCRFLHNKLKETSY